MDWPFFPSLLLMFFFCLQLQRLLLVVLNTSDYTSDYPSCQFHLCLTSAVQSRKDLFSGVKSVQVCEQSCLSYLCVSESCFKSNKLSCLQSATSYFFLLWDVPISLCLSLFCFVFPPFCLFQAPSPFNAPCFTDQNISDFFFFCQA